jgi:hypothetical protein
VEVKVIRLPAPPVVVIAFALPAWLQAAVTGRIGVAERAPATPAVTVRDEVWDVHAPGGGVAIAGASQAQAHQLATVALLGTAVAQGDDVAAMAF